MKLFQKLHEAKNEAGSARSSPDPAKPLAKVTAVDVLRYRYHNGTNLGSTYVLEKWLNPSMFPKSVGGSELDAVKASISSSGLDATRTKWEQHWQKAVSEDDWKWLKETAHCTTIRLPIGYYTLGPQFCQNTPFAGDVSQVYTNAWSSVKSLLHTARSHGIGILLDLHALPGGANTSPHSGTSSKEAGLWSSASARQQATECILFIAREAASDPNFANGLVGIQIVNEAKYQAKGMFEWYDSVLDQVEKVDSSIPIYVSDAWDLGPTVKWAQKRGKEGNPVVVDTHKYFCFGGPNVGKSPHDIINDKVPELFRSVDLSPNKGVSVVVGEWSCVLGEKALEKVGKEERGPLTKRYGEVQSRRWFDLTGGSFFWTWKMDWMPGGEWGYKKQINDGNLYIPPGILLSSDERFNRLSAAQGKREERYKDAGIKYRERHEGPLKGTADVPGYTQGWKDGWEDSEGFFQGSGDVIGLLAAWVTKRSQEGGRGKEWTEGFEAGVRCFRELLGV